MLEHKSEWSNCTGPLPSFGIILYIHLRKENLKIQLKIIYIRKKRNKKAQGGGGGGGGEGEEVVSGSGEERREEKRRGEKRWGGYSRKNKDSSLIPEGASFPLFPLDRKSVV